MSVVHELNKELQWCSSALGQRLKMKLEGENHKRASRNPWDRNLTSRARELPLSLYSGEEAYKRRN
jgi:hypothetical protein